MPTLSLLSDTVPSPLAERLTPEQQLANYLRRIENDRHSELMENSVEDLKVTMRRLRLCLLDQDPYDRT